MKAEQYIEDCTQKGSNVLCTTEDRYGIKEISYYDWLTPSQALEAVKLAREEMFEKVTNYINSKLYDWVHISNFGRREYPDTIMKRDFIFDLKQEMRDE